MDHEPLVYKVKEACRVGGFGPTKAYELIGAGVLDARKLGASTLITAESLRAYLAGLPKANITTGRETG